MARLALPVALLIAWATLGEGGQRAPVQSVPALMASMYRPLEGQPCVRLNTLQGPSGCGNPGRDAVSAPLQRLLSADEILTQRRAFLVAPPILPGLLRRALADPEVESKIAGVVVEWAEQQDIPELSPASQCPQCEMLSAEAEGTDPGYAWNPTGTDISRGLYRFPVVLLSNKTTWEMTRRAQHNEERGFAFPLYVVEFAMVMQTTKTGTPTSDTCLERRTCLPLGGYSVVSAIPFVNASGAPLAPEARGKPITLVLASLDAAAFFRDAAVGADTLSGAIALLAALDAVCTVLAGRDLNSLTSQLWLAFVTGEAWGFLGTRSLVKGAEEHAPWAQGLPLERIQHVLQVGPVGRATQHRSAAFDSASARLFAHRTHRDQAPSALDEALRRAAQSLEGRVSLAPASATNPGLPPSSLAAFHSEVPSVPGVMVAEFDSHFMNPYFGSFLDGPGTVQAEGITAAATLLARALLSVAGVPEVAAFEAEGNSTLVAELMRCLLTRDPGLACQLAADLITPASPDPNHYVGVFLGAPELTPPAWAVSDTSRLVWNLAAQRTGQLHRAQQMRERGRPGLGPEGGTPRASKAESSGGSSAGDGPAEECATECSVAGQVCVGSTARKKGRCLFSTTRYVPTLSPRLQLNESEWRVVEARLGHPMDAVDPVWTESFWQELKGRAYLQDSPRAESLLLGLGVLVLLLSLSLTTLGRVWVKKHLKDL